jgi:hypothetical protein
MLISAIYTSVLLQVEIMLISAKFKLVFASINAKCSLSLEKAIFSRISTGAD